ncbi:hypothetical protein Cyast_1357 [Cyanobacterium stanieri PCC 7202]|uniref:Uncharacterized protein n=1 Tax=Cyanobacterium stanieri (strain ATCC 29140 / PCC 7202) TaxID=292563 RepID=K9YLG8_CYASC|nr:hypothetical protein Cyast_1357 [Cyanobacterium stanieri PCC 7202]
MNKSIGFFSLLASISVASPLLFSGNAMAISVQISGENITNPSPTLLSQASFPSGVFSDNTWIVTLGYYNNSHYYEGYNRNTGDSIYLSGATIGGNNQRRTYTWNNSGYRYQVAWQPADPNLIRLQVYHPNGRVILNRLLSR